MSRLESIVANATVQRCGIDPAAVHVMCWLWFCGLVWSAGDGVFIVDCVAWHPTLPDIFATGGGDSSFAFWDKKKKMRCKFYDTLGVAYAPP